MIMAWLAAFALMIGAGSLYLASPNQMAMTLPVNRETLRIIGIVVLAAALVLLLAQMGPATAVFTWTVGLMLLWSVPPIIIGWLRFRREKAG